jgi:hypothetical protein
MTWSSNRSIAGWSAPDAVPSAPTCDPTTSTNRPAEADHEAPPKAKAKPDDREGGFDAWQARAGELLQKHGIKPEAIRHKTWSNLYIAGATPQDAAERAASDYRSRQTPKDRLRRK